ncbi:MAG TPA: CRISPR-associated endonuclease Cas1 [Phycisphaerae bacterium]|nr:CRISPR-associated endonuclease Cas1 [Phycisphaerae bacterium]
MDEYYWPARNVAEYAYCPRLFYMMEVEGIHLANADTEKGNAVHKRVDKPSHESNGNGAADQVDINRPKVARSLVLTSEKYHLTATLDLAEIQGQTAVPVEYRKGRPQYATMSPPPDDPGESDDPPLAAASPWPTDRVQLGLQALLLEDAGYRVTRGVIYYAAEKRRLDVEIDDALRQEALSTLDAARNCSTGPRPPPLVHDSRCLRCSLQPICLPDEVAFAQKQDQSPRRIWPLRDDAIHLVAQQEGTRIGVRGQCLRVTDREGQLAREIPLSSMESLAIVGNVQLSTQALGVLADQEIPVAYMTSAGRLVAMIDPLDSVSALVRTSQVRRFDDPAAVLELSRVLIAAKITNQRTILMRNRSDLSSNVASDLMDLARKSMEAKKPDELRGFEGQAAAIYFGNFGPIFKESFAREFDTNGRQRRPPPDPVNCVLSFGYTMLTHECVSALRLARLEPTIGAFHVCRPGRPALALDLMEPFRPLVADSVAISSFNRGELVEGHFSKTAAGCAMTDSGRKAFFGAWGRRMDTEITHPVYGYRLSYRRMVMLHARMIAAWLVGDVDTLSFLTTR